MKDFPRPLWIWGSISKDFSSSLVSRCLASFITLLLQQEPQPPARLLRGLIAVVAPFVSICLLVCFSPLSFSPSSSPFLGHHATLVTPGSLIYLFFLVLCLQWSLKKQAEVLPWVTLAALESEEMARGCSHCGHNGHNSRTCPDRGVRLFGVRLTDGVMRKSVSMSNLSHYASVVANPPSPPEHSGSGATPDGYVSDGLVQTSNNARERKKGMYADFFFFFSPCIS